MKAFDFEILKIPGPPRFVCQLVTDSDDSITLVGDSIKDIFDQCLSRFPEGIDTKGVVFSGINNKDAKRNLSEFLSMGFSIGYFKNKMK